MSATAAEPRTNGSNRTDARLSLRDLRHRRGLTLRQVESATGIKRGLIS